MEFDALIKIGLVLMIVAVLASPLALIAVLQLVKEKGKFSLLSLLTAASILAVLLGYASYLVRD